jgi:hypothetical protein
MTQTRLDGRAQIGRSLSLAESPHGCTRAIMLGRGFPLALIASLIRAGLATDQIAKRIHGGPRAPASVRITDAGRQALGEHQPAQWPESVVPAACPCVRNPQPFFAAREAGCGTELA